MDWQMAPMRTCGPMQSETSAAGSGGGGVAPAAGCDCRSCPLFMGNPQAPEPICSGCNSDCAYCGCARAEASSPHSAPCSRCPIRCGSRTDIDAWMCDVGGTLCFDDVRLEGLGLPDGLPSVIPQVDGSNIPELDCDLGWPAYAVGLRRVVSPTTYRVYPRYVDSGSAHQTLGLDERQLAVLVGYADDPLVEAVWTRRHQLVPQLAAHGWDLVLACNYSMYANWPRAEQLLNFRRSLLLADQLCRAGVAAVPNLYWYRREDLDRYGDWLADVRPAAVATNLQTLRAGTAWDEFALPGLAYLAGLLPPRTRLIVCGTSRHDRLAQLHALFGERMTLVTQTPFQYARHGAAMTAAGRQDFHARTADAFAVSLRYYRRLLDRPPPKWGVDAEGRMVVEPASTRTSRS